ncbi:MAG: glycoside hydrolase family 127 protein [Candidatus Sumerlaeota bacterium]|nr:glycoside hydrolase family 127 protein [Candidatus Sumerlaeota bacterium]
MFFCLAAATAGFGEVTTAQRPDVGTANRFYAGNRAPLAPSPFVRLPVGLIAPRGWLRHQLELEAAGMMGHLEEISKFLKFESNGWVDPAAKDGWEELPYWLRGYGDLGYVLRDEKIVAEARRWIDGIIATQQPDGWFGPQGLRVSLKGKADMWPQMPVLDALRSYYEFGGDERVLKLMTAYFKWQNALPGEAFAAGYWPRMRAGDNIDSVYWLYNRTGEPWLLDLARKIHENMADWTAGLPNWHNVNVAEGFREPAEFWMQARDAKPPDPSAGLGLAAAARNYDEVMGLYGQFPGGGFAGDENCRKGYGDPRQGFETCGIVEFMRSFEMLTRISGDPLWADRCEEIAFNSLPAALTPDLKALHYLTGANQVRLDSANKSPGIQNRGCMFAYSPHRYRCCQHNHGMGWPYYAEELWLATADNGLCASLYAACEATAKAGDGAQVRIVEETDYPFGETIQLTLSSPRRVAFPLYLRVPRWCEAPAVKVNGQDAPVDATPLSFIVIRREWADGDTVTLRLPMRVSTRTWPKNNNAVSVDYGPLTFSLKIGEEWRRFGDDDKWPEWEVLPATPWNYGLALDGNDPAASFELTRSCDATPDQPFTPDAAPIQLRAKARRIPNWTLDHNGLLSALQPSPVKSAEPVEPVTLIPMGAARLRISAFPVIGAGPGAHGWVVPPPAASTPAATPTIPGAKISASHCFDGNTMTRCATG